MTAYYNENNDNAAEWLENLIAERLIAPGHVDRRSIRDVRASDLTGYVQCHFFAGVGGWSIALRLAGWPDDRPVWSGSCPCQPFSSAGEGKAADDDRHLWPAWFPLVKECRPAKIFGEQVEAAIGWGWIDAVFSDLEQEGYACGQAVLPACCVGAPHIRQRIWIVADSDGTRWQPRWTGQEGGRIHKARIQSAGLRAAGDVGHAVGARLEGFAGHGDDTERWPLAPRSAAAAGLPRNFWSDCEWQPCSDGKSRPIGPGSFPLAHGVRNRTPKLRAYGNAIVPQLAAQFIQAAAGV